MRCEGWQAGGRLRRSPPRVSPFRCGFRAALGLGCGARTAAEPVSDARPVLSPEGARWGCPGTVAPQEKSCPAVLLPAGLPSRCTSIETSPRVNTEQLTAVHVPSLRLCFRWFGFFPSQLSHFCLGFSVSSAFPVGDPSEQVLFYCSAGSFACLCVRRWGSRELGSVCWFPVTPVANTS